MWGADLTLRWAPAARALYHQIVWQTEFMQVLRTGPGFVAPASGAAVPDTTALALAAPSGVGGLYSLIAGKVAQRWWVEGRYDAVGLPAGQGGGRPIQRGSALVAFAPSEFSAFRLQYGYVHGRTADAHEVMLQANVSIGAHPAHSY